MSERIAIRRAAPSSLAGARHMTHKAVQMPSNAARANLDAATDDSHANLGWDHGLAAFLSRPMEGKNGPVGVALNLAEFELGLVRNGNFDTRLALDGATISEADTWLDGQLADAGLKGTSVVTLPYEMPSEAAAIETYSSDGLVDSMTALSGWFDLAAIALAEFSERISDLSPTPIRCWTHHYDVANEVNFQASEEDAELTIGLGFSPGDENYDEPYFYVSPWSAVDQHDLPPPSVTGRWHTDGFVGVVATASQILSFEDANGTSLEFLAEAFALCRAKLGV